MRRPLNLLCFWRVLFLFTWALALSCENDDDDGQRRQLADTWLIQAADADLETVRRLAGEHHFELVDSVDLSEQTGYYVLKPSHSRMKRLASESAMSKSDILSQSEAALRSHPSIVHFERETVLKRTKRDFTPNFHSVFEQRLHRTQHLAAKFKQARSFFGSNANEDPEWPNLWYLNRNMYNKDLPDMNVTGAWAQGYSGKGVSVTFLDDGLEYTHPDLKDNYDHQASYDINANDNDPIPRYDSSNENKHGTRCAGEVAAAANNSICSVGVAYHAGIGGIRMLDGDVTDSVEARSLVFNRDHIHIYSASWGPDDNGQVVDGPGPLARQAFREGALKGRQGLGSVFVWASGNGGRYNDSCACDGYANSIYTLSISSTSENSEVPWYLEECTSTLATTYSSGDRRQGEREIATTDIRHQCTAQHTGTSAAAPIAAGIIALALEANPQLTWRDLMYITVFSARPKAIHSNNYVKNGRQLLVSSRYGFGLMDAGRMVELARNWVNVPEMSTCQTSEGFDLLRPSGGNNMVDASFRTNACASSNSEVNYIEQVEVVVTIKADVRGSVEIHLVSPMGTNSLLLSRRRYDKSQDGFKKWAFMTVQLWGESPKGEWKLRVSTIDGSYVNLVDFYLIIHGTRTKPAEYDKQIVAMHQVTCHYECKQSGVSCGPSEFDCTTCAHFSLELEDNRIKCVSYCPDGYFADNDSKSCIKCHQDCYECNGPTPSNCLSCQPSLIHNPAEHTCLEKCPAGLFLNSRAECEACSENCLTCELSASHCTSCENDAKSELVLREHHCVTNNDCGLGRYYNLQFSQCQVCDVLCRTCHSTEETGCTSCMEKRPVLLSNGTCSVHCPSDHYTTTTHECIKCYEGCTGCTENPYNCKACKPGYTLGSNQMCIVTRTQSETQCSSDCYECDEKMQCLACKNGRGATLEGKCVDKAPVGFYKREEASSRGVKFVVSKCKETCKTCTGYNVCQECRAGVKLINQDCVPDCEHGLFADEHGKCMKCAPSCDSCLDANTCLVCHGNQKLLDGRCQDVCPFNYYSNDQDICKPCYPSCQTCNGPESTSCLTCQAGFTYSSSTKQCISQCPQGTFFHPTRQLCELCNGNNCTQCIRSADMCTACRAPLVLDSLDFNCKSCCTRSVSDGSQLDSCCTCSDTSPGFCSNQQNDKTDSKFQSIFSFGKHHSNNETNNFIVFVSVVLLLIASGFILFTFLGFVRYVLKKVPSLKYGKVKYSHLTDDLEIS